MENLFLYASVIKVSIVSKLTSSLIEFYYNFRFCKHNQIEIWDLTDRNNEVINSLSRVQRIVTLTRQAERTEYVHEQLTS